MSGLPRAAGAWWMRRGQTMTEYTLIISSVILALVLLYQQAGQINSFLINEVVPLF
jgi:hypothetical protein